VSISRTKKSNKNKTVKSKKPIPKVLKYALWIILAFFILVILALVMLLQNIHIESNKN